MKYIDKDKTVLKMYDALYDGVGRTRCYDSAVHLRNFIENGMVLEPVYWLGLGFRYSKAEVSARDKLASYFKSLVIPLKGHVLPLVAWNKDGGKVRHDIHAIILARRGIPLDERLSLMKDVRRLYRHGKCYVDVYDRNRGAVFYQTLRHNEIPFMTFCRNRRKQCKGKKGEGNDCELRRKPELLLRR